MAISTYKVFLMHGTGSPIVWSKLLDIKDFPDLGGSPDNLQTTTLSDRAHTYIPGIDNVESLDFTANYSGAQLTALRALEGVEQHFAVWFGGSEDSSGVATPTGYDGKYEFDGYVSAHVSGAGVNEVVEMVVSIAPSSVIKTGLRTSNPANISSVAGSAANATFIVINEPAPVGTKWVYKLGTSDVTLTDGTAVVGYTNWASSSTSISASSNTKACVALVFTSNNVPLEYTNLTLVKGA